MGWGGFLDKVMEKLPIQGRIERAKNEKARLEKELADIEKLTGVAYTDKVAARESFINKRIKELDVILANKAAD